MDKKIFKLKNLVFNQIFKSVYWIIINLGNPVKYSLHVLCNLRICHKDRIILCTSDEFLTKDAMSKPEERYEELNKEGYIFDPDSLLIQNMETANQLLKNKRVKKVKLTKWKDLILYFEGDIQLHCIIDTLEKDFEYYRILEFEPFMSLEDDDEKSNHIVVCNDNGTPKIE